MRRTRTGQSEARKTAAPPNCFGESASSISEVLRSGGADAPGGASHGHSPARGAPVGRRVAAPLDVHPRVAMRVLRHAQIDVTMNVNTDVSDAKTRQALKRLGRQLGG